MPEHSKAVIESTRLAMDAGIQVELLNYGASLRSVRVPAGGELVDVVLAYADVETYLEDKVYLGATVGRYAGRIDSGTARLNGRAIRLDQNEQRTGHCLHGGAAGFSHQFWSKKRQDERSVSYEYISADGDQGFPGCLTARVVYRMTGPMSLQIEFFAETDQDTFINLSNHAYFNLNRSGAGIENHDLTVNSDSYTPIGENSLPLGEIRSVRDSVFDFRRNTRLGERLGAPDQQLQLAGGFDHFFLLDHAARRPGPAASVYSPDSGIRMNLFTDQPGVQFYSGNWLNRPFEPRGGLCLEFQDIPNAPNMEGFPSTILRPGETYRRHIELKFECDR